MKSIILSIACFIFAVHCFSQSPEKFSYQAVVRNTENELVSNRTIGVKINLRKGTTTGTTLYSETHSPVSNSNGLISFEIGAGTIGSGSISNIDWNNGPFYIEIKIDPSGGTNYTINNVSQLLSVPFAMHAESSNTVSATNVITSQNIKDGDITSADIANNSITDIDIKNEPGIEWSEGGSTIEVGSTIKTVSTIVVTAPTNGYVVVTTSGWVNWLIQSNKEGIVDVGISKSSNAIDSPYQAIGIKGIETEGYYRYPFSVTKVYSVSAGDNTFYFNCRYGTPNDVEGKAWIHDHTNVGMFFPTRY